MDPYLPVVGKVTSPIYQRLESFARSKVTVLLRGATGTGKSRLALWVHRRSARRERPFVEADLYGDPTGLTASALFGHRRGAFTGATETRRGRILEADGGTLFLDEVDKLDLHQQTLLLRVLERKGFRELGGETLNADVRLIIGTNANLEREVEAGRFREDLFYRINAAPIFLPSLEERQDEIAPWARYMLEEIHQEHDEGEGQPPPLLTSDAERLLVVQAWPGNLRQLRHVVERSWLLARSAGSANQVIVDERTVEVALLLDKPDELRSRSDLVHHLVSQLERAAQTGAQLILRRAERGEPAVPLSRWEGFAGLIVNAIGQVRSLDRGSTELFGLEGQLQGGNYRKTYQRLQLRGHQLLRSILDHELGPPADDPGR